MKICSRCITLEVERDLWQDWAISMYGAITGGGRKGRPMDIIDDKTWLWIEKKRKRIHPLTEQEKKEMHDAER